MESANHHYVLVRNGSGKVVHLHEVVDFDGVEPLTERQLLDAAVAAAQRAHPGVHGDLYPAMSNKDELEGSRTKPKSRE